MPAQHFSLGGGSAEPLVTISWDFGYSVIDIAYRGQPLTRITDATALRSTGMNGTTPDGAELVVHLRTDTWDGRFEVLLNGTLLTAAPVLAAAAAPAMATATGPSSRYEPLPGWQQYGAPTGAPGDPVAGYVTGPTHEQARRMKTGRTWLKVQGVLSLIAGVVVWMVANSDSPNSRVTEQDKSVLSTTAMIIGGVGVLFLIFAMVAKGPRAKTVFGVAMAIAALNALAGVGTIVNGGGSSVPAIIVSLFAAKAYYGAMKAAAAVHWPAAQQPA